MSLLHRLPVPRRSGAGRLVKTPGPTRAPGPAFALRTSARQLVGNLTITSTGAVWAGYRIAETRWDFLGPAAQQSLLDRNRDVWANVAGHDFIERVMTHPHPIEQWARNLDARTPNPVDEHYCEEGVRASLTKQQLMDGACGCETWNRHLVRMQRRIAQAGLGNKSVVRYFRLGSIDPRINVVDALHELQRTGERAAPGELRELLREEKAMRDAVRAAPWKATPLTEREQRVVRARALLPGVAGGWTAEGPALYEELEAETRGVRWHEDEFDTKVLVTNVRTGRPITYAVSVVTLLRPSPISYPESGLEPWQTYPERVVDPEGKSFSVEMTLAGRILRGEELQKAAEYDLNRAIHTRRQYEAWEEIPPVDIDEGIQRAAEVRNEVFRGEERVAARFRGSVNATMFAADVVDPDTGKVLRPATEVLDERVEAFKRLMRGNDLRQQWERAEGQSGKLQESIPGEAMVAGAYQRQFPLAFLSAGLPTVTAALGDGAGPYRAYTRGGAKRPVMVDSHFTTEGRSDTVGRKANLWLNVGSLGSGKSVWMMDGAYNDTRRRTRCVYSDPSGLGPARMAGLPEIAPVSIVRNMTTAEPGELNPPALVRLPRQEEFDTREKWIRALSAMRSEIRALVQDVTWMQMPQDIWDIKGARGVLRDAVRSLEWDITSDLWQLIDRLNEGDELSRSMAAVMEENADADKLRGMYAPRGQGGDFTKLHTGSTRRPVLTVITTPGLISAAPGVGREQWNADEMASPPLRHLAAMLTYRELFDKPMDQRASGYFDEAHHYKDSGSGRALLSNLGRDHSKWNIHGEIASQDLDGALVGDLRNYLAGALVGQMKNLDHAMQLLPILHIEDTRHARTLMELSQDVPGEFVYLDALGRVGAMRVDLDYHPERKAAMFTNPKGEGKEAWTISDGLA